MKGAAVFCLDWLVDDGEGHLVTSPSTSPEHKFVLPDGRQAAVSQGSTMEQALVWDLFTNTLQASAALRADAPFRKRLEEARARLRPLHIGAQGQLQEWATDWPGAEAEHRHFSHLVGLHPGREITAVREPGAVRRGAAVARAAGRRGHRVEPGLEGERLGAPARRRSRPPPAREPAASRGRDRRPLQRGRRGLREPVRRPPALPDRRELRCHGGDRRDARAEPREAKSTCCPPCPAPGRPGRYAACAPAAASRWSSSGPKACWPGRSCVRVWAGRVASEPTRPCEGRASGSDPRPVPIPTRSTRRPAPAFPSSWTPRRFRWSPWRPPRSRTSTRRRAGSTCSRFDRRATRALP